MEAPTATQATDYSLYYPDAGILTSTGDTCPGYVVPPELETPFWTGTDEERVSNPDSVYAANSTVVADPDYRVTLMVLDEYTGVELFAGPCEVLFNRCNAGCRRIPVWNKRARTLCWAGCMARYAACVADEEVERRRRRRRPPEEEDPDGCGTTTAVIYDNESPADEPCDEGSGGGGGGEGELTCTTEWVVIEVDDGTGWRVWWQGWVTVCE